MSCKPLIYVALTTPTAVTTNNVVPFSTIVRRRGCGINLSGNTVAITDTGSNYYDVDVSVTFTAPVAGDVTFVLQQNGTAVTGATATETITTPTTEVRSISFPATIRTFNNIGFDSLTLVVTGVGVTISNATMRVVQD